jgi:DNA-binding MarR family transcriptional regulator
MDYTLSDKELVFGVLSGRASSAINRRIYQRFHANGINLTPEQWMILQCLSYKDGISQQELARITYKDKPSITRMLDVLEKHALVSRSTDTSDRRSNRIHITPQGTDLHNNGRAYVLEVMREALMGFSEEEVKVGEKILKKVFINLE